MKIVKKEYKNYSYELDKFCCKRMKKEYKKDQSLTLDWETHKLYYVNYNSSHELHEYVEIDYCPFCGEKIEND